jgi:hypothetical protein
MPRAKGPECLYCGKRARIGTEHGYAHPRFCSQRCGFRYGLEKTVDMKWCETCADWSTKDSPCACADTDSSDTGD